MAASLLKEKSKSLRGFVQPSHARTVEHFGWSSPVPGGAIEQRPDTDCGDSRKMAACLRTNASARPRLFCACPT